MGRDRDAVRVRALHERREGLRLRARLGQHRGGALAPRGGGRRPGSALPGGGRAPAAAVVGAGLGVPRLLGAAPRPRDPAPGRPARDPRPRAVRRLPGRAQGGGPVRPLRARRRARFPHREHPLRRRLAGLLPARPAGPEPGAGGRAPPPRDRPRAVRALREPRPAAGAHADSAGPLRGPLHGVAHRHRRGGARARHEPVGRGGGAGAVRAEGGPFAGGPARPLRLRGPLRPQPRPGDARGLAGGLGAVPAAAHRDGVRPRDRPAPEAGGRLRGAGPPAPHRLDAGREHRPRACTSSGRAASPTRRWTRRPSSS